jgi:hypothetical protein
MEEAIKEIHDTVCELFRDAKYDVDSFYQYPEVGVVFGSFAYKEGEPVATKRIMYQLYSQVRGYDSIFAFGYDEQEFYENVKEAIDRHKGK